MVKHQCDLLEPWDATAGRTIHEITRKRESSTRQFV
jgi:hypothetical protein